jgi:DNA adenine methylase
MIIREEVRERVVLSPLRYPGGKRRLMPYVAAALEENRLQPDLFVEPFAGGASVALELLATARVRRIGLAERDPYVASFWHTVFFDSEWLCRQVEQVDVTLKTWQRMKSTRFRSKRAQALACLFLNRTSFNGTLHDHAGPIGGQKQAGDYKLDCRFPRARLVRRIRTCAALAEGDSVAFVREADALDVIRDARRGFGHENVFLYLDPPFWGKASRLYRFSFTVADHTRLANALRHLRVPYLLSYDAAPEIEQLYSGNGSLQQRVELLYTATQRTAEQELVISNLQRLPGDTRMWRTNHEWQTLRRRRGPVRLRD